MKQVSRERELKSKELINRYILYIMQLSNEDMDTIFNTADAVTLSQAIVSD